MKDYKNRIRRHKFFFLFFQLPFAKGNDYIKNPEIFLDVHCKMTGLKCGSNMELITVKHYYQVRASFSRKLSFHKVCIQQCMYINLQTVKNVEIRVAKFTTVPSAETARFVKNLYNSFFSSFLHFLGI